MAFLPNREPKSRLSQAGPGFHYAFATLLSLVAIVATARLIPPEFGANYGLLLLAPILTGLVAGFRPALLAASLCTVSSIGFGLRPAEAHPADALHFIGYLGIEALVLLGFWETHQRKRLQADLLREQESLQLALESSNAYSWRWDIATGIVSRSMRALNHVAQPNAVRESLEAALARIHPEDRERMREAMERARPRRPCFGAPSNWS